MMDWWLEGACRNIPNPDIFFPEHSRAYEAPKAICRGCSVREKCLEYALTHRMEHGCWGGTDPDQRKKMRARYDRHAPRRLLIDDGVCQ